VRRIRTSLDVDQLINTIKCDEARKIHVMEPLAFNILQSDDSDEHEYSSNEMNGDFLHCELLLNSLLTMNASSNEKSSAIAYCRGEYENSESDYRTLDEFESNYSADRALYWYTRDSFLYRMLNKAFRMQNIDVLYLMRFFIRDIRNELVGQQAGAPISAAQVYRGQLMLKEELESFEVGKLISMSSFFSTTLDRAYASFLLPDGHVQDDLASVLFEIDISPHLSSAKPFADITEKSAFPNESEILFMAGSIFRIIDIQLKNDGISVVQLVLCSDDDHDLKALFEHMCEDVPPECTPLTYGIVLANAGKHEQAEFYFRKVLMELSADDPLVTHCYHQLGNVLDDRGKYDESLEYFERALAKKMEILPADDPSVANTHTCCGVGYFRKSDFERALISYQKALDIYKKVYGDENQDVAMCLYNIGDVRMLNNDFEDALRMYQQALSIWTKCLPDNHPDLARSHVAIAKVHRELLQIDQALEHQTTAFDIMVKSLPADHHELAVAHDNMGNLCYAIGDNECAEEHFEEALRIKQKHYSVEHAIMADSYHGMGLIYKDKGDYRRAASLLEQALAIQSKMLDSDHEASLRLQKDLDDVKMALSRDEITSDC
jgi:tetratricopeptide (TPR) repeat protein